MAGGYLHSVTSVLRDEHRRTRQHCPAPRGCSVIHVARAAEVSGLRPVWRDQRNYYRPTIHGTRLVPMPRAHSTATPSHASLELAGARLPPPGTGKNAAALSCADSWR